MRATDQAFEAVTEALDQATIALTPDEAIELCERVALHATAYGQGIEPSDPTADFDRGDPGHLGNAR